MADKLSLTIVYEDGDNGWTVASVPEVPGAHSQGRSRKEARENVIDALHGILELRFGEYTLSETALYWPARDMGKPLIDIDDKEALGLRLDREYLDRLDR